MDLVSAVAIFVGAGCGALLRWLLGIALDPVLPVLPLGTLAANVIGGLLMGVALGMFSHFESLSPAARLALTTGFLGGLTTFSTFSGESVTLVLRAEYLWAAIHMLSHLALSLLATFAGLALANSAFQHLPGGT